MTDLEQAREFVKQRGADVTQEQESTTGLRHVDLLQGTGASPKSTDKVTVHYTGWLTNGKKFDSSVDRREPATFKLNQVISGWTEGVGSMKEGGKRLMIIPSNLGYGANGAGGVIPPNATLIFEVELLKIG
jgi:peptidylprolyl isomerase